MCLLKCIFCWVELVIRASPGDVESFAVDSSICVIGLGG